MNLIKLSKLSINVLWEMIYFQIAWRFVNNVYFLKKMEHEVLNVTDPNGSILRELELLLNLKKDEQEDADVN